MFQLSAVGQCKVATASSHCLSELVGRVERSKSNQLDLNVSRQIVDQPWVAQDLQEVLQVDVHIVEEQPAEQDVRELANHKVVRLLVHDEELEKRRYVILLVGLRLPGKL